MRKDRSSRLVPLVLGVALAACADNASAPPDGSPDLAADLQRLDVAGDVALVDGPSRDAAPPDAPPLDLMGDGPHVDATAPTSRFPGDPGPGKIYVGFIAEGGNLATHQGAEAALASVDYGAGAKARKTGIARLYTPGWSWSWKLIDSYTATGKLVWWSFKPQGSTEADKTTFMSDVAAGKHDTDLQSWAGQIKSRAPTAFWYTFQHEPENDFGANTTADTPSKKSYRAATRYIYNFFKSHGVTNLAHVSTTFMQDTFFSQDRPWYHYYPDWKGTSYTGGYNTPAPTDFYGGAQSVVDLVGFDAYCFHGQGGPGGTNCPGLLYTWTKATYLDHDMYTNDVNKHARKLIDTFKTLGKPMAIGEWGYHLHTPGGNVDLATSLAQYQHVYQDLLANNIVGVVHWMGVAPTGTHAYEFGQTCTGAQDPTDARRKGFAWWLDQNTTVTP